MTSLISLLAKATLILLAGLLASQAARGARASVRHLILACTFAALLALPVAAVLSSPRVIEVPSLASSDRAPEVQVPRSTTPGAAPARRPVAAAPLAATSPTSLMSTRDWMATTWALGASTLLAILAIALFRLREVRQHGLPWTKGEAVANTLARERGIERPIAVLLHEGMNAPITCGVWRPLIVLPKDAPQWAEADLHRAFVHELEHVRRGDWMIQLMARGVAAVYWFHPLTWVAWRQMCLEGERACDDAVLAGAEGTDYADQLVSLAERMSQGPAQPVLSMANRSDLAIRVRAVLDSRQLRGRAGRSAVLFTLAAASTSVLVIAPLRVEAARVNAPAGKPDQSSEARENIAVAITRSNRGPSGLVATATLGPALESGEQGDRKEREQRRSSRTSRALGLALIEAAQDGDLDGVVELLARGADVNSVVDGDGTPLIGAARAGQFEIARLLLDRGADPNLGAEGDGLPLISAAREGSLDVAKLLLDRGADINKGLEGDGNPLIMAAGEGGIPMVTFLLDRGANIEAVVPGDENPLIKACEQGQLETVKFLVSRGANVQARVFSEWGDGAGQGEWRTPVSMAKRGRHNELVQYLLSVGAPDAPASKRP